MFFKGGKHLSQELVDAYLNLKYFNKDKNAGYCVFPATLWKEIEAEEKFPDFSIFEHKTYLIFPMELRREFTNESQWVVAVIQRKQKNWNTNPELSLFYYDSSCPQHLPDKLLIKILEALTSSIFASNSRASASPDSLLNNHINFFKVNVPAQDRGSSSGVHMLYHIDQVFSNPMKWLNKNLTVQDDIDKKYRAAIKQYLINHFKNSQPDFDFEQKSLVSLVRKKSVMKTGNKNPIGDVKKKEQKRKKLI